MIDGRLPKILPGHQRPDELPWLLPLSEDDPPDRSPFDRETLELADLVGVELPPIVREGACGGYANCCSCERCATRSVATRAIRAGLLDRGMPEERAADEAAAEAALRARLPPGPIPGDWLRAQAQGEVTPLEPVRARRGRTRRSRRKAA